MSSRTVSCSSLICRKAGCVVLGLIVALPVLAGAQVHLLPAPREAQFSGETGAYAFGTLVVVPGHDAEDEFAARDLQAVSPQMSDGSHACTVTLLRADSAEGKAELEKLHLSFDKPMEDEGYVLSIEPKEAFIVGATGSGIFYGVQTLKQLISADGAKPVLPTGVIRDWPAMKYRGIDDDLSRGPFPTLEFQKHQIRVFASYKINIYSPYLEHTLLYPDQPLAAPPGSALTPEDVAELVSYARQYHITVIPEQEAFGHLHHVLKYEMYQDLAETPHGHVLAPGQPGTLPLIKDWFTQLANEFPSPFLHIGADETFDLGMGRTRAAVQSKGYGPVYVDFVKQIHDELAPLNRRLLFWGDIGGADPNAVAGLPKDMIAIPWNYWDTTGFDKMLEPFAKAGIETWVSPGDNNWNQVYPVAAKAFGNIQGFVRDGQRMGSTGALTTVWNDDGEGLFNEDWYSVLFGAVAAWQPGESPIPPYQEAFGPLFHGDLSGKVNQAQLELIAAHAALARVKLDDASDQIFWIDPWSAEGQTVSTILLPVASELRLHAEKAIVLIAEVRRENSKLKEADALTAMDLGARRLDLIGMKFQFAQELVDGYAQAVAAQHDPARQDKEHREETRNTLDEVSSMNGRCQDLRDAYSATKGEYIQVWQRENRPYWLNNVTVRYDMRIEQWQRRGERFLDAIQNYDDGKDLPSAASLGMPVGAASH